MTPEAVHREFSLLQAQAEIHRLYTAAETARRHLLRQVTLMQRPSWESKPTPKKARDQRSLHHLENDLNRKLHAYEQLVKQLGLEVESIY